VSLDRRFMIAADTYRGAVLDVIRDVERVSAFAATTLACCSVDLLSHTLNNPTRETFEESYKNTVLNWIQGYGTGKLAQVVYDLRCGLVHEFRTAIPGGGGNALLSDRFDGEPFIYRGDTIISTKHFCREVREAFERFFSTSDALQRRAFVDRAYIFIAEAQAPAPHFSAHQQDGPHSGKEGLLSKAYSFSSTPVSGSNMTGFYLQPDDGLDVEEMLRAARARGIW
jgi:hypothetical protein